MDKMKQAYQRALTMWWRHPMLVVADVAVAVILVVWAFH